MKFVFQEQLGLSYQVVDDLIFFSNNSNKVKINYSDTEVTGAVWIKHSQYFIDWDLNLIPDFGKSLALSDQSSSQMDLFAAIFYLLARVEEYGASERDQHNRFRSQDSILAQKGLLNIPLIDLWVQELRQKLETRISEKLASRAYTFVSTIDVDHIFAYKGKALSITFGSLLKDVICLKWSRVRDRVSNRDPYDRLADMMEWHTPYKALPHFFILTAARGKYDKSLPPSSPYFQNQVKLLNKESQVGIHPSYQSNETINGLSSEKETLENLTKTKITKSRQHFLKLSFPETYRGLITAGIKEDYTMGYPDILGFRAGTSLPFHWYDLLADKETELMIVPFQIMDVTLKKYLNYNKEEAVASTQEIIESIKSVDGQCSIIWHNSSFYAQEGWEGWDQVYKEILSIASA